jgi:PREDICTED: similar to integrin alpha 1
LTGQVVFFSKLKDNLFNVDLILSGEQFASSFGYSMISMDINGDRYVTLNHFITTIRISKSLKTVAYF